MKDARTPPSWPVETCVCLSSSLVWSNGELVYPASSCSQVYTIVYPASSCSQAYKIAYPASSFSQVYLIVYPSSSYSKVNQMSTLPHPARIRGPDPDVVNSLIPIVPGNDRVLV